MKVDLFAILRVILVAVCLIMACVGCARPQFSGNNTEFFFDRIRYGVSQTTGATDTQGYSDLPCTAFGDTMRAAFAMSVMACIALGVTLIFEILLLLSYLIVPLNHRRRPLAIGALVSAIISFSLLLIGWAVSEHGRSGRFCGSSTSLKDNGFKIQEGLGLLIAAWCLMLFEIIVAILAFAGVIGKGTAINDGKKV